MEEGKTFFFYVPANAIKMIKRHIRNTGTHCNRKGADITRNEELSFKYEMLQCYSNCQWQVHSVELASTIYETKSEIVSFFSFLSLI